MNHPYNSHAHQNLILLKSIARRGGGGSHYGRGVLAVIEQIERDGHFVPSSFRHLADPVPAARSTHSPPTHAETGELQHALADRGWTTEQWAEFAAGVARAEAVLGAYRREAA